MTAGDSRAVAVMADAMRALWTAVEGPDGTAMDRFPSKEAEARAALDALQDDGYVVVRMVEVAR